MVTAPVLQLPNFDLEFTVTTDASEVSVRAILQQDFGQGLQPICYDSRKLNPAECQYSAYNGSYWASSGQLVSGDTTLQGTTLPFR